MIATFALLLGQASQRTYFEWVRLQSLDQWWHWIVLVLLLLLLASGVIWLYRKDARELPLATRLVLIVLRLAAFAGLLLFFLQLEKRSEQRSVNNSRFVLLVDTSQSMGLTDVTADATAASQTRLDLVREALGSRPMLSKLRQDHDVIVYHFDQDERPAEIGFFAKVGAKATDDSSQQSELQQGAARLAFARRMYVVAAALLLVAVIAVVVHVVLRGWVRMREGESWALLVSVMALIIGLVCAAVVQLRNPDIGWPQLAGRVPVVGAIPAAPAPTENSNPADATSDDEETLTVDWQQALQPVGVQTRMGDALRWIVEKERGGPFAGIAVLSDGNQNAGRELAEAISRAKEAEVPLYAIGIGNDQRPKNLRIADVEAPPRVFPGDSFSLTGYVQAFGLEGSNAKVELLSRRVTEDETPETPLVVEERAVRLGANGQVQAEAFQLEPQEEGKYAYTIRVSAAQDELDKTDNEQAVTIEFVHRKTRVLLLAGGPTREYRFVRNQYYRDPMVDVDVVLQSSPAGAAQEADQILESFPNTTEEMFLYDAVLAFDPNWDDLPSEQIALLERWVAESAGGLIVVAGGVYTPEWSGRRRTTPAIDTILGLYPVTFYSQSAERLIGGRSNADEPWPLEFTQEGQQASYLWLGDTADDGLKAWLRFPGVYAYYPVRGAKAGATVLARFSNPETAMDGELPVYMATQFYGAGRVFYMGTGEMWRLRSVDEPLYEQFYTKLLRYVSEGRLLRDSSHGLLLVGKERCTIGEVVPVRAVLQDSQHQPLTDPEVEAKLTGPDGLSSPLLLKLIRETSQAGTYTGQFVAQDEGNYRVDLVIPDTSEFELLSREVQVRMPELEIENPQRNDANLRALSQGTGGRYYVGLDAAIDGGSTPPLHASILPKSEITFLPSVPDLQFERHWMTWLMAMICGALSLEWLIRRIHRLA